jgi:hypothetical protein
MLEPDSPVSTLHRHVNHLVDAGLIATVPNPLPGQGRPGRLLYLTRLGLATTSSDEGLLVKWDGPSLRGRLVHQHRRTHPVHTHMRAGERVGMT